MGVTTVRLPPETEQQLEQVRWRETLEAIEAASQGRVIAADQVHDWLKSWGAEDELPPPEVAR